MCMCAQFLNSMTENERAERKTDDQTLHLNKIMNIRFMTSNSTPFILLALFRFLWKHFFIFSVFFLSNHIFSLLYDENASLNFSFLFY